MVCRGAPRWLRIPCPALRDLSPRETDGAVRGGGSQACCHGCSSRAHSHPGAAAVAVSSVGTAPPSCIAGDVSLSVSRGARRRRPVGATGPSARGRRRLGVAGGVAMGGCVRVGVGAAVGVAIGVAVGVAVGATRQAVVGVAVGVGAWPSASAWARGTRHAPHAQATGAATPVGAVQLGGHRLASS